MCLCINHICNDIQYPCRIYIYNIHITHKIEIYNISHIHRNIHITYNKRYTTKALSTCSQHFQMLFKKLILFFGNISAGGTQSYWVHKGQSR